MTSGHFSLELFFSYLKYLRVKKADYFPDNLGVRFLRRA